MQKILSRLVVGIILLLTALIPPQSMAGQSSQMPIECMEIAFSTEEEFVTQGPEPPDGNPILSDGDLLGYGHNVAGALSCVVCARNADLLAIFQAPYDLGLDAADILDIENYIVAFSTELDSSNQGQFTAGDLLVTNGAIIPNLALTHTFLQGAINYDLGLDVIHFVGTTPKILAFLDAASQYSRSAWLENPDLLVNLLIEFQIDIWYSTEGTWSAPTGAVGFLDGDLLSARSGVIVVANKDLLPLFVPAGIPARGVDFGLDAFTGGRSFKLQDNYFSTEILYEGELNFTDGDVLKIGDGIAYSNNTLLQCFEPMANFLGLDALSIHIGSNGIPIHLPLVLHTVRGASQ